MAGHAASTGRSQETFFYGGQAVIEGVMMRGRRHYAVAVREPRSGQILVRKGELRARLYRSRLWRLPFARGLALLAEQLHLGTGCLMWSAAVNAGATDLRLGRRQVAASVAAAVAVGLALFVGLPLLAAGAAAGKAGSLGFVLVESLLRAALVLGYLVLVGLLPDVHRVFQYHGAEHKTINAFEANWPLEVAVVRRASPLHPRCGTGFLVVVVLISVFLFGLVGLLHPGWPAVVASRLLGVPVIAGASYEVIRLLARHRERAVVALLLVPVLQAQRLTTREPDEGMLEVSIAAFNAARQEEGLPLGQLAMA